MISNGITSVAQYLSLPFSMLVVLGVWVPFFMRLQSYERIRILEKRFDYRVDLWGVCCFCCCGSAGCRW